MDEGKFFRGLAKVRDYQPSLVTMQQLLELDDRLLGIGDRNKNFCDYGDCMAYKLTSYDYYGPCHPHEDWYCWRHKCIKILNRWRNR